VRAALQISGALWSDGQRRGQPRDHALHRRDTIPVAYTRHAEILLIGTPFAWGRNLRTGEPVEIRLKGQRRPAGVQVFTDEASVTKQYAVMARDNHNFARFNKIRLDQDGNPNPADLRLAWAAGARAFRLTPCSPGLRAVP
jgi:hypothetical protein